MKVVITAEEMQQIVADFMSRQTAFGEVSGVTFSANGATVFFNEEPVEDADYEDDGDEDDSASITSTTPKKNRRRRRTKAEMKAAQETLGTEPEEQEPVAATAVEVEEVEATTEPADIDTPVEDDLLSTAEEPAVDTTAEPDLFTEDDDDLFK